MRSTFQQDRKKTSVPIFGQVFQNYILVLALYFLFQRPIDFMPAANCIQVL